jgi:large subunit ribosomal protein L10
MAITKADKEVQVAEMTAAIKESSAVYLVDYTGIPVGKDVELRKLLAVKNITYRAAKNTLIKLALKNADVEGLDAHLKGVSAILLGDSEEPMVPAKIFVDFLKENKDIVKVKSINFDGSVLDGSELESVSKMPGRKELIAQIVNIAIGPGANLVAILKGPGSKIAGAIDSIEEK